MRCPVGPRQADDRRVVRGEQSQDEFLRDQSPPNVVDGGEAKAAMLQRQLSRQTDDLRQVPGVIIEVRPRGSVGQGQPRLAADIGSGEHGVQRWSR